MVFLLCWWIQDQAFQLSHVMRGKQGCILSAGVFITDLDSYCCCLFLGLNNQRLLLVGIAQADDLFVDRFLNEFVFGHVLEGYQLILILRRGHHSSILMCVQLMVISNTCYH